MRFNSNTSRMFTIGVGATALALLCAWSAGAQAGGNVTWSSDLHLKSLADIPNRMREPVLQASQGKRTVMLTNGNVSREVRNCDEYLNALTAGFYAANNFEKKWEASFGQCFVLRDLQHARPATSSNSYEWNKDSLAQLPPVLVVGAREITDAVEQAEKRGESWQQFNPALKLTDVDRDKLGAEDADFAYSLDILARGDFNGDGAGDIAVFGCAMGKHSTWDHCEYFIVAPTNSGMLVRLTHDVAPYRTKVH